MPKRSTLRLTTRSVAALPATGRDAVYWDRDLAGFGVRVQRNGRKVYVVQSRGPAGLKRVTLGPCAGVAMAHADVGDLALLEEAVADHVTGTLVLGLRE